MVCRLAGGRQCRGAPRTRLYNGRPCGRRDPVSFARRWIPAFAGMTPAASLVPCFRRDDNLARLYGAGPTRGCRPPDNLMRSLRDLLEASAWARALPADLRARVEMDTITRKCAQGGLVCRKGEPVNYWMGIVDGLVKMASVSVQGPPMSFTCISSGGWFS